MVIVEICELGNVGMVICIVDVMGVVVVIFVRCSVDLYNGKCLCVFIGSIFVILVVVVFDVGVVIVDL